MKRGIPIILTALGLLLSFGLLRLWLPASTTGGPLPALQGEAALNHLKEQGLYGSLQEAVTAARFSFYQEPKRRGAWLAYNPAQRLSARLTSDGLQVVTGGDEGGSHRLGVKLRGAGYGERLIAAKAGRLTAIDARAEIRHELPQSAIIEWYQNTAAGLEQGFTIESAPGERRAGERLRVALALEGELTANVVEGGKALEFRDDAMRPELRYDHLVVRDGTGRELEARMAAPEKEGEVWLEVDDRKAVWPITIDPTFTQQQKLEAPDARSGDAFGWSVAISGDTVVVGAPFDADRAGSQQGSAYVFVRNGAVWSLQQKLLASDARSGFSFGDSVAISDDTIVVGAVLTNGPTINFQGSAYVFVRNGGVWSQQQELFASDAEVNDRFGDSVAISGDTLVVGASKDDGAAGGDQGSAYVFVRSGGVWTQQQKLISSDAAAGDHFGCSVAISGETVVVGARNHAGAAGLQQGSAYVFARSEGVWSEQQELLASDGGAFDLFGGNSLAISGETVVVGAELGGAAANRQGSAYVFARSGTVWTQQQKLLASDGEPFDNFGWSVGISGGTVVVGAMFDDGAGGGNQGSAYVFVSAPTNTPPAITAASLSLTQDLPASIGAIAQVNDAEDALNTLNITVNGAASATAGGVTVSSISVNASGQVTASVGADCNASNASFTLRVADSGGLFAEATLNVTVTPERIPPVIACAAK